MSTVEQVALWIGLLSSVVSIVLSCVAIWFAVFVDRSAREVTAQTIRSLQKIESAVERASTDTRELIKAGWDKMLGQRIGRESPESPESAAKDIAAGVAAELRAELQGVSAGASDVAAVEARINDTLQRLESTLAAQIRTEASADTASVIIDQALAIIKNLTPEARALLREITQGHLTRRQYSALVKGPLAKAVRELRDAGVLVPLQGVDEEGSEIPVYYFPARMANAIRAVIQVIGAAPPHVIEVVKRELERVGYCV